MPVINSKISQKFEDIFKNQEDVEFLSQQGFDLTQEIDQPSKATGNLAIHDAVFFGKSEIVKMLLNFGIDINATNSGSYNGQTPLSIAASIGHGELVTFLLSMNANPQMTDNEGEFPLLKCARRGLQSDCDNIEKLVNAGADINQENVLTTSLTPERGGSLPRKNMTALMYAMNVPSRASANRLIEIGASVTNSKGISVLAYCFDEKLKLQAKDKAEARRLVENEVSSALTTSTPLQAPIRNIIQKYLGFYSQRTEVKESPSTTDESIVTLSKNKPQLSL